MKMSVYCVEVKGTPDGDLVVMNTERGFLRAALVKRACRLGDDCARRFGGRCLACETLGKSPDGWKLVKWLGKECKGDVIPRRQAQEYAHEVLGYWK